jgi:hypothetical protein
MNASELNIMLVAPCGINCTLCISYQRDKNNCCGCNITGTNKANHCQNCKIKNCDELATSDIKFCYACNNYPCKRLKQLDKRYQLKYGVSVFENLWNIAQKGIEKFISDEHKKWQCDHCGKYVCMHRNECLTCGAKNIYFPTSNI